MIVKNIFIQNSFIFIEELIKELINNNINYLLIKNDNYFEIHFDKYIYNLYYEERKNIKPLIHEDDSFINSNLLFEYDREYIKGSIKKTRPGFKKNTKKDIKNLNRKYKI